MRGFAGRVARRKSDVWEYGKVTGKKAVTKAIKWNPKAGGGYTPEEIWVDEDGNEVDTSAFVVVESSSDDAHAFAKSVAGKLA